MQGSRGTEGGEGKIEGHEIDNTSHADVRHMPYKLKHLL